MSFDFNKIEEIYKAGEATEENIEAVTGKLEFNKELKTEDDQGDLVTIIRTKNNDGQEVIEYVRRTTREENDSFAFTVAIGSNEVADEVAEAETEVEPETEAVQE